MKYIRKLVLSLTLLLIVTVASTSFVAASGLNTSSIPIQSFAAGAAGQGDACDALSQLDGTKCKNNGGNPEGKVSSILGNIVGFISYIAGVIAIIMIIVAGIRYTTSGGDSNKVSAAKTSLIYALVGIAVAGACQILVHLVLSTAAGS